MSVKRSLGCVTLATALSAPWAVAADFEWHGPLQAGQAVEIKGVNGDVNAEWAPGPEVRVVARKHGRRSSPEEVQVVLTEHPGGITVCALYPSPHAARPNVCEPGRGGRMDTRDNDVSVDFTVEVPSGVGLVSRTVNGSVRGRGLKSDVRADSVNGSVSVETTGVARATTVNGSIAATLGRLDGAEAAAFRSVNGSITLELPAEVKASVQAETVNGEIDSAFPLLVQGRILRKRLQGTVGGGGPTIEVETVNGSIHLRSAPP